VKTRSFTERNAEIHLDKHWAPKGMNSVTL